MKIEWISTNPDGPPADQSDVSGYVCADTVAITVNLPARPQAGADRVLACNGTSSPTTTTLNAATNELAWSVLQQPNGTSVTINAQGQVSGLSRAGDYLFLLKNTSFSNLSDTVKVTVPADCTPPFTLAGRIFMDNGLGGGNAQNGIQEVNEVGLKGVALTLYTDPNKDGNVTDGTVVSKLITDAQGNYSFASLSSSESYIIAIDPINFSPGNLLVGWRSTYQLRQSSYGMLSGLLSSQMADKVGILPLTVTLVIGLFDPCSGISSVCIPIRVRRLR